MSPGEYEGRGEILCDKTVTVFVLIGNWTPLGKITLTDFGMTCTLFPGSGVGGVNGIRGAGAASVSAESTVKSTKTIFWRRRFTISMVYDE